MLGKYFIVLLIISPLLGFGQRSSPQSSDEVPILWRADLPMYPPIAEAAHFTGNVTVRVTVQNGKVVKTEIVSEHLKERSQALMPAAASHWLTAPTIENLKTWRFDSSVNDTFVVDYTYEIAGAETDNPTNPRVEFLPSLDVKITARPVKPTVNY